MFAALFGFIAKIFGYLLYFIYEIVGNYGLSIIIFTLITKLLMIPSMKKQQKSLEQNKKMQPLLKDLQNKYKNDPNKLNEEYQKLLKDNKFNPLSGCLMSLIQIPILIGMLYVVGQPLTNMVKMPAEQIKQEIISVMPEGSEIDVDTYIKQNRYVELEVVKRKNLLNLDFLGINLGDIASNQKDNYILLIIPILSAVFTYLSVYVISKDQKGINLGEEKKEGDMDIPMPDMRVMNFMMPVMSGWIAYIVPQGLGLYWFVGSLVQIIVQLLIKKALKEENEVIRGK